MASPGRRPFDVASPDIGIFAEIDSTQAMQRSFAVPCLTTALLTRNAAKKTESKALRHCSSLVPSADPAAGPPTLINAPSSRPKASSASAQAVSAVLASVRSAASATARSGPIRLTASASISARRATSTTRAPSVTSCSAAARPRPLLAAVTTNARSASPRSMIRLLYTVTRASAAPSRSSRLARRSLRMNTTMPAAATAVNINHCTAYQKCGPSESSGSWIG